MLDASVSFLLHLSFFSCWFHWMPSCACIKKWGEWKSPVSRLLFGGNSTMTSFICFHLDKQSKSFKSLITWELFPCCNCSFHLFGPLESSYFPFDIKWLELMWCSDEWFITDFCNSNMAFQSSAYRNNPCCVHDRALSKGRLRLSSCA